TAELGWHAGQRVAGTSHAGCGLCRMCRIGRYNLCDNYGREPLHHQYGHYSQGADAEYVVHSIKAVFPLPDEIELCYGAMIDTASIALHSVKRPGIEPGDVVVVVGAGPMGFLIVSGRVRVKPVVTQTFPLAEYGQALHTFAERLDGALRVIIEPGQTL